MKTIQHGEWVTEVIGSDPWRVTTYSNRHTRVFHTSVEDLAQVGPCVASHMSEARMVALMHKMAKK